MTSALTGSHTDVFLHGDRSVVSLLAVLDEKVVSDWERSPRRT